MGANHPDGGRPLKRHQSRSVQIIEVPYHLGRGDAGVGVGPRRWLDAGGDDVVEETGATFRTVAVSPQGECRHEIGAAFAVAREVARHVRSAVAEGAFPLVLAGECSVALGVIAGLRAGVGVIWFDAHADFNTPETTVTGYLGGMVLAAAVGRCWQAMCDALPGFRPLPEEHAALVGARALDAREARLLADSRIQVVSPYAVHTHGAGSVLAPVVAALRGSVESVYLHVDMDVLDPQSARANAYAEPGGLTVDEVEAAVQEIGRSLPPAAAALTAYDPRYDESGAALEAGCRLMVAMIRTAFAG